MSDSPTRAGRRTPPGVIGQMAGEYRLHRKLGEGGFGTVYEAEHPVLKRRAAVKVLHRASDRDSDAVLRFVSEAQAVNQIRSRHIIDVFSFGQLEDGHHFYVMDLLEGEPLDRHLDRVKQLDVPSALQLLRPITEALDVAHAAGIVHRDLKPQNIFLSWEANGETVPKLLDFGLAKLLGESPVHTVSGTPMGTPLYMSPEQAQGHKVDGRSDVYALGVLCHELLTGAPPFSGETTVGVLMAHIAQPAPRISERMPELAALDEPVQRMLEKLPDARPKTAGEALAALINAAESAGYLIPRGLPHLLPPERDTAEATSSPDDAAAMRGFSDTQRDAMVRSTARPQQRGPRWSLIAAVVILCGAAVYLAASMVTAPQQTKGSAASAVPSQIPLQPAATVPSAPPKTPVKVVAPASSKAVTEDQPKAVDAGAKSKAPVRPKPSTRPQTRGSGAEIVPKDLEDPF